MSIGRLGALPSQEELIAFLEGDLGHTTPLVSARLAEPLPATVRTLLDNKGEMARVGPRHLELLVGELLRADGFEEVEVVTRINAPGPDVVAFCHDPFGNKQKMIVECKVWQSRVGVSAVRELFYRLDQEHAATYAMLVATSEFTEDAISLTNKHHYWRLKLVGRKDLAAWIRRTFRAVAVGPVEFESWVDPRAIDQIDRRRIIRELMRGWADLLVYVRRCQPKCSRCGDRMICLQLVFQYVADAEDVKVTLCNTCGEIAEIGHVGAMFRSGRAGVCELCSVMKPPGEGLSFIHDEQRWQGSERASSFRTTS